MRLAIWLHGSRGKDAVNFLEGLTVADLQSLQEQSGTLSLMTNEQGGVKDDSVITKIAGDHVYLVVNAGCREKDIEHFKHHVNRAKQEGKDVDMHVHEENGIIAVQGPKAQEAMQTLTSADLETLYFSQFADIPLANSRAWVTRTGYTGEDGFEVALPKESAESLVGGLLKHNDVRLAGLGARDSLRLEAGLCLYGSDLTEDITPVEAGLTWTIGKRRREKYDFLGGGTIKHQVEEGPPRRRFGMFNAGPPARAHSAITTTEGENVGEVTSGAFSPNLNRNIAMGYATRPWNKQGTQLKVQVRNKAFDAESTKMPFVPMKFHRPPEQKQ